MLWLVNKKESHEIISCNIFHIKDTGEYQLWATKPGNKSFVVKEGNEKDIKELKEAIDWAIEHKETALRLE